MFRIPRLRHASRDCDISSPLRLVMARKYLVIHLFLCILFVMWLYSSAQEEVESTSLSPESCLLICFGNKIQRNQQYTNLSVFPHSPWEPSCWGLVNEPGLAGWMTGHVWTNRHHRIRQWAVRQVEEVVLEQLAPTDHRRHLSTPAETSEAWPMGSSMRNHKCGRNTYCFRPSMSGQFYPVTDDW